MAEVHDMEGVGVSTVNLEKTAAWLQKGELRFQRMSLAFIVAMGFILVIVGMLFQTDIWQASTKILDTSVPVLLVCGTLVIAAAIIGLLYAHSAATELEIGPTGIRLKGPDGKEATVRWNDSSIDLTIVDRRSVPVERRNTHVKDLDFILRISGTRLDAGIALGTVKQIMRVAGNNGLMISGWHEEPSKLPRSVFIRIQHTRVHR